MLFVDKGWLIFFLEIKNLVGKWLESGATKMQLIEHLLFAIYAKNQQNKLTVQDKCP